MSRLLIFGTRRVSYARALDLKLGLRQDLPGASPVGRGVVGPLRRGLGEGARVVWGCPDPDGMPLSFSSGQLVTRRSVVGPSCVTHVLRWITPRALCSLAVVSERPWVRASREKADCRLAPQP